MPSTSRPIRRPLAMLVLAAQLWQLTPVRADPPAAPDLPTLTPAELKELAADPLKACRAPTADEQRVLDADPAGALGRLGAITEDDLKGILDELETTGKELEDKGAGMLAELKLKQSVEPKFHVHYKFDEAFGTGYGPRWRTGKFAGMTFDDTMVYYRARKPDVVVNGLMTMDEFEKAQRKAMKPEPPLQYLTMKELESLVAQTELWAAADDVEPVLGVRAYRYGPARVGPLTSVSDYSYVVLIGQNIGIAYQLHHEQPGIWILNDKMPGFGTPTFEAKLVLSNISWGRGVSRAEWFTKSRDHVRAQLREQNRGEAAYFLYQLLGAMPLTGTLVELEKLVNAAPGASWGKFGLNLFRDIGLVTIFIPGGVGLAIMVVADVAVVVLAFAIDDKDKWTHLTWTAATMGLVAAVRIGSVMRATVLLVKAGTMALPKTWGAVKTAYGAYLAALARWRAARGKPCLKVKRTEPTAAAGDGPAWIASAADPVEFLAAWFGTPAVAPVAEEPLFTIEELLGPWSWIAETCATSSCPCEGTCGATSTEPADAVDSPDPAEAPSREAPTGEPATGEPAAGELPAGEPAAGEPAATEPGAAAAS